MDMKRKMACVAIVRSVYALPPIFRVFFPVILAFCHPPVLVLWVILDLFIIHKIQFTAAVLSCFYKDTLIPFMLIPAGDRPDSSRLQK